jgi:hypothetical protein
MIRIYGHSDDLVEVEGEFVGEENEFSCWQAIIKLEIEDKANGTACVIVAEYARDDRAAVWHIGVEPSDEDKPMPEIKVEFSENRYSPVFVLDCSRSAIVRLLEKKDQE